MCSPICETGESQDRRKARTEKPEAAKTSSPPIFSRVSRGAAACCLQATHIARSELPHATLQSLARHEACSHASCGALPRAHSAAPIPRQSHVFLQKYPHDTGRQLTARPLHGQEMMSVPTKTWNAEKQRRIFRLTRKIECRLIHHLS